MRWPRRPGAGRVHQEVKPRRSPPCGSSLSPCGTPSPVGGGRIPHATSATHGHRHPENLCPYMVPPGRLGDFGDDQVGQAMTANSCADNGFHERRARSGMCNGLDEALHSADPAGSRPDGTPRPGAATGDPGPRAEVWGLTWRSDWRSRAWPTRAGSRPIRPRTPVSGLSPGRSGLSSDLHASSGHRFIRPPHAERWAPCGVGAGRS